MYSFIWLLVFTHKRVITREIHICILCCVWTCYTTNMCDADVWMFHLPNGRSLCSKSMRKKPLPYIFSPAGRKFMCVLVESTENYFCAHQAGVGTETMNSSFIATCLSSGKFSTIFCSFAKRNLTNWFKQTT